MLILTRRVGESFTVTAPDGQKIHVRILAPADCGDSRLGIEAPKNFSILRDNAKLRAAASAP